MKLRKHVLMVFWRDEYDQREPEPAFTRRYWFRRNAERESEFITATMPDFSTMVATDTSR